MSHCFKLTEEKDKNDKCMYKYNIVRFRTFVKTARMFLSDLYMDVLTRLVESLHHVPGSKRMDEQADSMSPVQLVFMDLLVRFLSKAKNYKKPP